MENTSAYTPSAMPPAEEVERANEERGTCGVQPTQEPLGPSAAAAAKTKSTASTLVRCLSHASPIPVDVVLPMPRLERVKQQLEFYFSPENVARDFHLRSLMTSRGYVPIARLLEFPRLKSLASSDVDVLTAATTSLHLKARDGAVRSRFDWHPHPSQIDEGWGDEDNEPSQFFSQCDRTTSLGSSRVGSPMSDSASCLSESSTDSTPPTAFHRVLQLPSSAILYFPYSWSDSSFGLPSPKIYPMLRMAPACLAWPQGSTSSSTQLVVSAPLSRSASASSSPQVSSRRTPNQLLQLANRKKANNSLTLEALLASSHSGGPTPLVRSSTTGSADDLSAENPPRKSRRRRTAASPEPGATLTAASAAAPPAAAPAVASTSLVDEPTPT